MARARLTFVVLSCVVLAIASTVSAAQQTLGEAQSLESLLNSSTGLRVGDKLFTNFSYTPSGGAPPASDIMVEPVQINITYGLHFVVTGFSAVGSQVADGAISFQVTADEPNLIDGVNLSLGTTQLSGTGSITIVENVFGEVPGQALTPPLVVSTAIGVTGASAAVAPARSTLFVFKNVIVAGGGDGSASVTDFYQTFHQTQTPEPATLAMVAVGGLAMLRRRRR